MIMYRTEDAYGSGERDIKSVMLYEMFVLNNIDILEYVTDHYLRGELKTICQELLDSEDFDAYNDDEAEELVDEILEQINSATSSALEYCLWLADINVVKSIYGGSNIDAYETSDVILSNLGKDGILFAYEDLPEPVE